MLLLAWSDFQFPSDEESLLAMLAIRAFQVHEHMDSWHHQRNAKSTKSLTQVV